MLFDEIKRRVIMIYCRSCRNNKQQDEFRDFEGDSICEECIVRSNAYAGLSMLNCNACGVSRIKDR